MRTKILILTGVVFILGVATLLVIHAWIGQSARGHIETAMEKYPGTAEDALIAYLLDENNSMENRTFISIWTLGQLRSEKALPILRELYRDDPEGNTCYGHHDTMLCQYEIHKAMRSIEKGGLLHPGLISYHPE